MFADVFAENSGIIVKSRLRRICLLHVCGVHSRDIYIYTPNRHHQQKPQHHQSKHTIPCAAGERRFLQDPTLVSLH